MSIEETNIENLLIKLCGTLDDINDSLKTCKQTLKKNCA